MENPKIRFKGFTKDWEQRKLGEVFEFQYGEFNNNPDNGGEYPIYGANGIIGGYTDWNAENSSIIGHMGAYAGYVVWGEGKHFVTYNGTIARPKDNSIDSKYGYYLLDSKKIYKICAGSGQPFVSYSDLNGIDILLPKDKDEQRVLAYYFTNLDHLITLHQRKCEQTKKLKKYMLQKMFPQNGAKVPEIRFDGFTYDWEQRKLGEVLISLQNNTLSRADLSNETGIAKNVHYGDVLIKFGDVLNVSREQLPMIKDEMILDKYKASFLQNGDVIIADTAEDTTVGKCSEIAGLRDEVVLSGLHTIPYRPVEKFATGYLGYYLNSDAYHDQLIPLMQGIKVTSISKSAMKDTDIVYPKSTEEQAMIGSYFQSLDHLITLHQRKCDELKKMKKYMLQNMFI